MPFSPHASPKAPRKNRYAAFAKINEPQLRDLVRLFAEGETAARAAVALQINRNTANRYFQIFRETLTCGVSRCLRVSPLHAPLIGLFLEASWIQARIVPETFRGHALNALTGGCRCLETCLLPDWPAYDALGEPSTGAFLIMPCCLVGPGGQKRLSDGWHAIRDRLCRCRGIRREEYWRHVAISEMAVREGPEHMSRRLLKALAGGGFSS